MAYLFYKDFEGEEGYHLAQYFRRMLEASGAAPFSNSERAIYRGGGQNLYMARTFNPSANRHETAMRGDRVDKISVVNLGWNVYTAGFAFATFKGLVKEIREHQKLDEIDFIRFCFRSMRRKKLKMRIERLHAFYANGNPNEDPIHRQLSLLEEFMFNQFARQYYDITLIRGENAPAEGSWADHRNKEMVMYFIEKFGYVLETASELKSFCIADIQRETLIEHFKLSYILDALVENGLLRRDEGVFSTTAYTEEKITGLKINAIPYTNDYCILTD